MVSIGAQINEQFLLRLMRCRGLGVPARQYLVLLVIEVWRRLLRLQGSGHRWLSDSSWRGGNMHSGVQ